MAINDWVSVWRSWPSKSWVNEENKTITTASEMINDPNAVPRAHFNLRETKRFPRFRSSIATTYLGADNVTGPTNGLDVALFTRPVNLVAQVTNVDIDHVGFHLGIVPPHLG